MKIYRSVHPPAAANYEMIQRDECRTKVSVFWWGSCLLLHCGLLYNATGSYSIVVIQTEISFSLGASEISGSMIIGAGGILCSVKSAQPESGFLPGVSDLRSESSPWPPPLVGDSVSNCSGHPGGTRTGVYPDKSIVWDPREGMDCAGAPER